MKLSNNSIVIILFLISAVLWILFSIYFPWICGIIIISEFLLVLLGYAIISKNMKKHNLGINVITDNIDGEAI